MSWSNANAGKVLRSPWPQSKLIAALTPTKPVEHVTSQNRAKPDTSLSSRARQAGDFDCDTKRTDAWQVCPVVRSILADAWQSLPVLRTISDGNQFRGGGKRVNRRHVQKLRWCLFFTLLRRRPRHATAKLPSKQRKKTGICFHKWKLHAYAPSRFSSVQRGEGKLQQVLVLSPLPMERNNGDNVPLVDAPAYVANEDDFVERVFVAVVPEGERPSDRVDNGKEITFGQQRVVYGDEEKTVTVPHGGKRTSTASLQRTTPINAWGKGLSNGQLVQTVGSDVVIGVDFLEKFSKPPVHRPSTSTKRPARKIPPALTRRAFSFSIKKREFTWTDVDVVLPASKKLNRPERTILNNRKLIDERNRGLSRIHRVVTPRSLYM